MRILETAIIISFKLHLPLITLWFGDFSWEYPKQYDSFPLILSPKVLRLFLKEMSSAKAVFQPSPFFPNHFLNNCEISHMKTKILIQTNNSNWLFCKSLPFYSLVSLCHNVIIFFFFTLYILFYCNWFPVAWLSHFIDFNSLVLQLVLLTWFHCFLFHCSFVLSSTDFFPFVCQNNFCQLFHLMYIT